MIEERYNFNTSDTNYLETKRPGASVVNQAISEMDKKYAAHFDRMKNDAIAMADQRSRNFQKFGQLIKQGAQLKQQFEEWDDTRKMNKYYDDQDNESSENLDIDFPANASDDEKTLDKQSNAVEVEGIKQASITKNAADGSDNRQVIEEAQNINEVANSKNTKQTQVVNADQMAKQAPLAVSGWLNEGVSNNQVKGANGKTYWQLVEEGNYQAADQVMRYWGRVYLHRSGANNPALGRHRRKVIKALLDHRDTTLKLTARRKLDESVKQGEAARVLTLATNLTGDNATEFIFGTKDDPNSGYLNKHAMGDGTGKKNMSFAFSQLGADLDKAFEAGLIDAEDIRKIKESIFEQNGTNGKKITLAELNTPASKALLTKLDNLESKAAILKVQGMDAKIKSEALGSAMGVVEEFKTLAASGTEITVAMKDQALKDLSAETGLPPDHDYFKSVREYYIPGQVSDQEEADNLIRDAKNGMSEEEILTRANFIEDADIKKDAITKAKDASKGFVPSSDQETQAKRLLSGVAQKYLSPNAAIVDPDLASVDAQKLTNKALHDYNRIYMMRVRKGDNRDEAHAYALEQVEANLLREPADIVQKGTYEGNYYSAGAVTKRDPKITLLPEAKALVKESTELPINNPALTSDKYLPGEQEAALIAGRNMKANNGEIPDFYIELAKVVGMKPYRLMQMRHEALGLDDVAYDTAKTLPNGKPNPDYGKPIAFFVPEGALGEEQLSADDQALLDSNPTGAKVFRAGLNGFTYDVEMDWMYEGAARQGANYTSFVDGRGRTYSDVITEDTTLGDIEDMFNAKESRSGMRMGENIKVGRYPWTKTTFNEAMQLAGFDRNTKFDKEAQDALVRGHILHTSMKSNSFTGLSVFNDAQEGFRPEAYEPFQVDGETINIFEEEFGGEFLDPYSLPTTMSTGLVKFILSQ